jgi:hypothetical protein
MAQALVVYMTIQDAKGDKSLVEIPVPLNTDLADMEEIVTDLCLAVDDMILGAIVNAGFRVEPDLSGAGLNATPGVNSDVQERGRFVWRTEELNLKSVSIPTWDEALMTPNSKDIFFDDDPANAPYTFNDMMVNGWTLDDEVTTVEPCDYRGEDLTSLVEAKEAWGKVRR